MRGRPDCLVAAHAPGCYNRGREVLPCRSTIGPASLRDCSTIFIRDRILASYETGRERAAYVEPVAVGDRLPDMPLFITNARHIMVPLESTYQATWDASPEELRTTVETGVIPAPGAE